MDVFNHGAKRMTMRAMAILTPAGLPEQPFRSLATSPGDPRQPVRGMSFPIGKRLVPDGLLGGVQHRGHLAYLTDPVDQAGILAFHGLKFLQPARQLIPDDIRNRGGHGDPGR
jgi:hypothetical protein